MDSSRIAALKAELQREVAELDGVLGVYLFGSAAKRDDPADVDLVVVYGQPLTPFTAPTTRRAVEDAVRNAFDLPAHLMFFTEREAAEHRSLPGVTSKTLFAPVGDSAA